MPLILLWICLTGINLNKAFHIDDTFHLEAARWIAQHPTTPMSGTINWKDFPTPMHSHNQPPLFFYLIAAFTGIFGTGEIPLHLMLSLFTFLALFFFYKLAGTLSPSSEKTLLLLFAFSPALIVNQNLMTDVPLLALVLASAYYLLKAAQSGKPRNYSLTALLLSAAMLIKYSVLPLIAVLVIVILIRRDYRYLATLLIPASILCLWSWWNYAEYGSVHFLDRPKGGFHINRLWAFVACTGSMSAYSITLIYSDFRKKPALITAILFTTGFLATLILFVTGVINDQVTSYALNVIFIINGFLIFYIILRHFRLGVVNEGISRYINSPLMVILLYLGATSAFMIVFAPFIATRHILLIIPFILLFCHSLIEKAKPLVNRISAGLTIALGLLLGISDYLYADYYRTMARQVQPIPGKTIWTTGHWGWQWYSEKQGMKQYALDQSPVKAGDVMVYPGNISRQVTGSNLKLILVEKKWKEPGLLTFVSGHNMASMYSNSVKIAPWTFSLSPIDTIFVFRIDSVKEIDTHETRHN